MALPRGWLSPAEERERSHQHDEACTNSSANGTMELSRWVNRGRGSAERAEAGAPSAAHGRRVRPSQPSSAHDIDCWRPCVHHKSALAVSLAVGAESNTSLASGGSEHHSNRGAWWGKGCLPFSPWAPGRRDARSIFPGKTFAAAVASHPATELTLLSAGDNALTPPLADPVHSAASHRRFCDGPSDRTG